MNNHSQPPSVAYSARVPDREQLTHQDNAIQPLADTPLEDTGQGRLDVATTSVNTLVRRAQVCFTHVLKALAPPPSLSECVQFSRCK